ncbi:MAG: glycosyltransferase [Candidatus Dojkabacteria bacterium]|nr:MAG: glycosyltransferase [Candidatus Dojkabacteria bacterium]
MKEPLVTVIMASYNHEKFVGKAIESVLNQTYQNIEFLIGDDASPDNSVEIISRYAAQDKRIQFVSFEKNRSEHIRNYWIHRAKGKYIAIINSDDEFELGKIQKQVEILEKDNSIGLVFTRTKYINEAGEQLSASDPKYESYQSLDHTNRERIEWLRYMIEGGRSFVHSSAMYRKDLIGDVGYNQLLALMSDFDMWIRLLLQKNMFIIDEPLTNMRMLSGSKNMSANTVGNQNRVIFEFSQILQRVVSPDVIDDLTEIFPQFEITDKQAPQPVKEYNFYKYCIDYLWQPHQQFGIHGMYKLLHTDKTKNEIEAYFGQKLFGEFYKYSNKLRIVNFNYPELTVTVNEKTEHLLFEWDKSTVAEFTIPNSVNADIHVSFPNIIGTVNIKSVVFRGKKGKSIKLLEQSSLLEKINWNDSIDVVFVNDIPRLLCLKEGGQISFSFPLCEKNFVPEHLVITLKATKQIPRKRFSDFLKLSTLLLRKKKT